MASKGTEIVDIHVSLIRETEKALFVESHITAKRAWVPKSMVEFDGTDITIPTDLAKEKELI